MENQPQQTQYDPQAVAMVRALKMQESTNNYNAPKEKAGTSLGGAYQYQAPTWKAYAGEVLGNPNAEFTPENQDKVTYGMVKKWKDSGMQPGEIAHMWNPGDKAYPGQVVEHLKKIAQKQTKTEAPKEDLTKDKIIGGAGDESLTAKSIPVLDAVPGANLAKGLAYAIGGKKIQKGLMESQDQAIDIQTNLLKRIKEKKSKGEDTSRLEGALKDLSTSITDTGNKVTNAGTGGLTNKEVLKSAGSLAALPATAYATGALTGGGVLNTAKGLKTGMLTKVTKQLPKALQSEAVKEVTVLGKGEKIGDIPRKDLVTGLENALKEMKTSQIGTKYEKQLLQALKALNPSEKQVLLQKVAKVGTNAAKLWIIDKAFGGKVGGFIKHLL